MKLPLISLPSVLYDELVEVEASKVREEMDVSSYICVQLDCTLLVWVSLDLLLETKITARYYH